IQVLINVKGDIAPRIRENTVASIRTLGLLGDRYIELSAGTPESPPVSPGGLIASIDPVEIEALVGQGGDIVTNIVEVTASLKDVLGSIQRGEGLLGAMLRNRELGEATLVDLQRTMTNVQATTASLAKILERVDRGEGVLGQLTGSTKESRDLIGHVRHSARSLDQLTTRLNRGNGALARLMDDEAYAHRVLGNLDRAITRPPVAPAAATCSRPAPSSRQCSPAPRTRSARSPSMTSLGTGMPRPTPWRWRTTSHRRRGGP